MKKLLTLTIALAALAAWSAGAADGKALYAEHCTKCHGDDGKGQTKMGQKFGAKDYTDAKVQAELKDEAIVKAIKDSKLKVQASIQGDFVRVAGKDRDVLQNVIALLRNADFGIDMQFINYRTN